MNAASHASEPQIVAVIVATVLAAKGMKNIGEMETKLPIACTARHLHTKFVCAEHHLLPLGKRVDRIMNAL